VRTAEGGDELDTSSVGTVSGGDEDDLEDRGLKVVWVKSFALCGHGCVWLFGRNSRPVVAGLACGYAIVSTPTLWFICRSMVGGLSLIYAWSVV